MAGISLLSVLFVMQMTSSSADHRNITSGQKNVTLTCRAPNNNTIIIVEWSRADLGDKYVLLYRNERFDPDNQHPSFKNRVDLKDRQMKDGDVSLILKNVTINDTGTYECCVKNELDSMRLINSIDLHVVPPGQTGGHTEDGSVGLKVCLPVVIFLLLVGSAFVGYLIYRKYKQRSQDSYCPTTEPQIEMSQRFLSSESPANEHNDRNDPEENSCHQHSTRIPDATLTLENELLHPHTPQETAGLLPESDIRVQ
ncbi:uncharacterized protein LOC121812541 [Haplochromis burtoni]|uniref:uncharacterized protein LOC121812541 n=1 Tax=Haplochromis burtoni TaxID=8153 RepID=UPI001C2D3322|nr:uncharacterized protein LOC121812541 [Haplochromis burtoni]